MQLLQDEVRGKTFLGKGKDSRTVKALASATLKPNCPTHVWELGSVK